LESHEPVRILVHGPTAIEFNWTTIILTVSNCLRVYRADLHQIFTKW